MPMLVSKEKGVSPVGETPFFVSFKTENSFLHYNSRFPI